MKTADRSLLVVYTGPIRAGVHTTVKALDHGTPFCEEEASCPFHRVRGKHLDADIDNYVEELDVPMERHGRSYDVEVKVGQQRGALAGPITELFDLQPMTRKEFGWLQRCDAIVFVVNSKARWVHTVSGWLRSFRRDIVLAGGEPDRLPLVFQLNKRDLREDDPDPEERPVPVETLKEMFQWPGCRYVESIAMQRIGVFEALGAVIDLYEQVEPGSRSPRSSHREV